MFSLVLLSLIGSAAAFGSGSGTCNAAPSSVDDIGGMKTRGFKTGSDSGLIVTAPATANAGDTIAVTITAPARILGFQVTAKIGGAGSGEFITTGDTKHTDSCTGPLAKASITHGQRQTGMSHTFQYKVAAAGAIKFEALGLVGEPSSGDGTAKAAQTFHTGMAMTTAAAAAAADTTAAAAADTTAAAAAATTTAAAAADTTTAAAAADTTTAAAGNGDATTTPGATAVARTTGTMAATCDGETTCTGCANNAIGCQWCTNGPNSRELSDGKCVAQGDECGNLTTFSAGDSITDAANCLKERNDECEKYDDGEDKPANCEACAADEKCIYCSTAGAIAGVFGKESIAGGSCSYSGKDGKLGCASSVDPVTVEQCKAAADEDAASSIAVALTVALVALVATI